MHRGEKMRQTVYDELRKITPEEQRLLNGQTEIETELYMSSMANVVDAKKLIDAGKLIQIRPHTRFVHFPKHTHNYIELIYMYSGKTHHVINGNDVYLEAGELLLLNQKAEQEIYPALEDDVAVNFIILPRFFDEVLKVLEPEENLLRDFVIDCLKGENETSTYMHFKVSEILPIQNLIENLIWTIMNKQPNKRSSNQVTMGLLFLHLMNHMDLMETDCEDTTNKLMIDVLSYIEANYREGELSELAQAMHYDLYWLSKEIKKRTGENYIDLVQTKRLNEAAYLLTHTAMTVDAIALAIGYSNISYFHRLFKKRFQMTPKAYRSQKK